MGTHFGIGKSGVSQGSRRVNDKIRKDKKLKSKIDKIARKLDLSRIKTRPRCFAMVKILVSTQPKGVRTFIRTHVGRSVQYDNAKIRQELGMTFRPVKESILEAVKDLLRWKHLT